MANPSEPFVTFYTDAIEFKAESEKAGRPIFKDVPFVRIIIPGDANNIIERVAKDRDKKQYPQAWARYEAGEKDGPVGMRLEMWPQITRAQVKEAKYFEVHTVEQLAKLSDLHCQKLGMGFMPLRDKAKAYLSVANDTAAATAQAAELEQTRREMADLRAQIAELSDKRGPGRPRKEVETA